MHFFHHDACMMSYLVLSRNGEETFNKLLSPDPDPDPDHIGG